MLLNFPGMGQHSRIFNTRGLGFYDLSFRFLKVPRGCESQRVAIKSEDVVAARQFLLRVLTLREQAECPRAQTESLLIFLRRRRLIWIHQPLHQPRP